MVEALDAKSEDVSKRCKRRRVGVLRGLFDVDEGGSEGAPQREHGLREVFNALRGLVRAGVRGG